MTEYFMLGVAYFTVQAIAVSCVCITLNTVEICLFSLGIYAGISHKYIGHKSVLTFLPQHIQKLYAMFYLLYMK